MNFSSLVQKLQNTFSSSGGQEEVHSSPESGAQPQRREPRTVLTPEEILRASLNLETAERLIRFGMLEAEQNEAINRHEAEIRQMQARWDKLMRVTACVVFVGVLAIGLALSKFLTG